MILSLRSTLLPILLVALPVATGGCAASSETGSTAPASGSGPSASSSGGGATLEAEVEQALTRFLENFIESAGGRDPDGEKVVAAWQFLPPSVQNKLSGDSAGPSPDMITRYLELSERLSWMTFAPDIDFEIEIIEADFMTKTGSARITLNLPGEPVTRIFKLERVNCEGIIGLADEFNERIEECRRTNLEPWKITNMTAPE